MHRTTGDNHALDSQGRRIFTAGPPPTTLDEGWANAVQEEIARAIEASGQTLAEGPGSDVYGQLALAIQKAAAYDAIVYSQETFNAIWERTAANAYKLRDDIGSIYFKAYAGGYNMSGPSSPLSGGDTWGVFSTNLCTFVMCDGGNFFQMGDTPSYWSITTSNTVVYNMDVRGVGAVAAAITRSIYIVAAAENCKLLFPTVSLRYSNGIHQAIQGNNSTVLLGAEITAMNQSAGTFSGITGCSSVIACTIHDCTFAAGAFIGISPGGFTPIVANCNITDISAITFTGILGCQKISTSLIINCSSVGELIGISGESIVGCNVANCESTTDNAKGFSGVNLSGNRATNISSAAMNAYGFFDCDHLSSCKADVIETSSNNVLHKAVGFQDCTQLSACTADTITASADNAYSYGFNTCKRLSACYATTVTALTASRAYGFNDCDWMDGSCEATAIDDFEFYDCSQEPFKGNAAAATPYGYTEVYSSTLVAKGSTVTYTPAKDCHLFGYVRAVGHYSYLSIRIGNSDKNVDLSINATTDGPLFSPYSFPVKAGIPVYFAFSGTQNAYHTLRYQPYGTTT